MTKKLRLRHAPEMFIDATVDVFTGRRLVVIDSGDPFVQDISLTPGEAKRVARALVAAAEFAERKRVARVKKVERDAAHDRGRAAGRRDVEPIAGMIAAERAEALARVAALEALLCEALKELRSVESLTLTTGGIDELMQLCNQMAAALGQSPPFKETP